MYGLLNIRVHLLEIIIKNDSDSFLDLFLKPFYTFIKLPIVFCYNILEGVEQNGQKLSVGFLFLFKIQLQLIIISFAERIKNKPVIIVPIISLWEIDVSTNHYCLWLVVGDILNLKHLLSNVFNIAIAFHIPVGRILYNLKNFFL